MRRWDRLNARQLAVLQRAGGGDELSGQDAVADRSSARALANRGLIGISRRGGVWRAKITDAGRHYLDHGHHPDDPSFRGDEPTAHRSERPARSSDTGSSTASRRRPPRATAAVAAKRRDAAQQLLAQLEAAGQVVLPAPGPEEQDELRRVIDFAKRHGMAPARKRIEKFRRYDGSLCVRLVDTPHPNSKPDIEVRPVPMPTEVDQLHPLLATLSKPGDVLGVSPESLSRALRIVHALLTEAECRGYEVGWAEDTSQGIEIRIDGHVQTVTMEEEQERQDVLPSSEQLNEQKVYSWQRVSPVSAMVPSGKLAISLAGEGFRVQQRWADRKRWSLEDRLADVLATVEWQAQEKEQRRRDAEEERLNRQRQWEEAMASARARYQHDQLAKALNKQLEAWELAERIRAFCQAAERSGGADAEWLTWARTYASELDPTTCKLTVSQPVEPNPEDVRPYLHGWSPYGPDRR